MTSRFILNEKESGTVSVLDFTNNVAIGLQLDTGTHLRLLMHESEFTYILKDAHVFDCDGTSIIVDYYLDDEHGDLCLCTAILSLEDYVMNHMTVHAFRIVARETLRKISKCLND